MIPEEIKKEKVKFLFLIGIKMLVKKELFTQLNLKQS